MERIEEETDSETHGAYQMKQRHYKRKKNIDRYYKYIKFKVVK